MNIIFICGSLEPGRNGVGDYTRRLAGELVRQNHNAGIIALNEDYLSVEICTVQHAEGVDIQVLRIPSRWSARDRFKRAREWIESFNPEWLSLQFVPFSFQPKGLPVSLGKQLAKLGGARQWHIMFHEIWVGNAPGDNWKRLLYSFIQKNIVKQLIKTIHPLAIHTHLPVYWNELKKIGYNAKNLPLFSNIETTNNSNEKIDAKKVKIGIFSQIEYSRVIRDFIINLTQQAKNLDLSVEILLIGGNELKMRSLGNKLSDMGGQVTYTGFLEPQDVSAAIQSCTIGLTSVPRHGLGKSGSVAAFLSHGVPVAAPNIFPNYDPDAVGFFSTELKSAVLLTPDVHALKNMKVAALAAKESIQLPLIAKNYLCDLISSKYE